jgi:CelD/BcsL family acetyltransferase involved in cellulose biosynthesis
MRSLMKAAFHSGLLHLSFLEIDGIRSAAYLSFRYDNQLFVYNSGVNPQQFEFSPGWVLLGDLLEWANEQGLRYFDFMRGSEDYKYKFGAVSRTVNLVKLTPPARG